MAAPAETVLFQAVCTPARSLTPGGFKVLAALLGAFAGMTGLVFLAVGAWPILPFLGLEIGFALALVALHRHGTARRMEVVILTPERLTISRTDARGRREEVVLDPYWARLRYAGSPVDAGVLRIASRGQVSEIGRDLSAEEKLALHDALQAALTSARHPVFDNPQLRDG